jgi:hypothetical protein
MDKSMRLAASLDPRCGVLSTGEIDPSGQSAQGRMLTVRFTKETVDLKILSRCQADAAAGRYACLTGAYIRWLAPRLPQVLQEYAALVTQLEESFATEVAGLGVHDRHPRLAAQLAAGYRPFLEFAVASDAIGRITADALAQQIDQALLNLVRDQAEAQIESSPAERFIALLIEGMRQQRFHLVDVESGDVPAQYAGACGWHEEWRYEPGNPSNRHLEWRVPSSSKRIGFVDFEERVVYLGSEGVQSVAQGVSRDQGKQFEGVEKIGRELADAKMLRTATEKGADGSIKTRLQPRKRIKNHGNSRYYAILIDVLFERVDERTEEGKP